MLRLNIQANPSPASQLLVKLSLPLSCAEAVKDEIQLKWNMWVFSWQTKCVCVLPCAQPHAPLSFETYCLSDLAQI